MSDRSQTSAVGNDTRSWAVRKALGYPSRYRGLVPIGDQAARLAKLLALDPDKTMAFISETLPRLKLPSGSEGWGAIASVDAIVRRHFPEVTDTDERYVRALDFFLRRAHAAGPVYYYAGVQRGEIWQMPLTVEALAGIAQDQPGDILVVPIQFGKRYAGLASRDACAAFDPEEFGLGALGVGCLLFNHDARNTGDHESSCLASDCPGDRHDGRGQRDLRSDYAPYWHRAPGMAGRLSLHFRDGRTERTDAGHVTAFVPKVC